MALYFFHTQTTAPLVDDEGTECETDDHAKREAVCTVAALVCDQPDEFWITQPWSMQVADTTGAVLFEIEISGRSSSMLTANENLRPSPDDGK